MNKIKQRKICLDKRKSLDEEIRKEYSKIICDKLFSLNLNGNISSYYPFNDEVDITAFNNLNNVYYPVINNKEMDFYRPIDNQFIMNKYHILEPDINKSIKINKNDLNYMLIPCVGFDDNLYRIGYGGGYYDRYLKDYEGIKIGISFDIQKIDQIITDEYDIKLDMIITEKK